MANKCPKFPREVKKAFKEGASEVNVCGPRYDADVKVIKRKGIDSCKTYRKKDYSKECFE